LLYVKHVATAFGQNKIKTLFYFALLLSCCYNTGMKKGIIFVLLITFAVFIGAKTVSAFSFGNFFGGRIIDIKALEIRTLENVGYTCDTTGGSSIEIIPIGSPSYAPSSYFIPSYIYSKTGYPIMTGQLIIGRYSYSYMTPITCIYPSDPPFIQVVFLNTIDLFGTSEF